MLSLAKELLSKAKNDGYAIGAFNTYNLEVTQAIIRAGEAKKSPLTIQISETTIKYAGFKPIVAMIKAMIDDTDIPIALHLDHGKTFEIIKMCIDAGFSSVQIDGSALKFEENISLTKKVVKLAHQNGVFVQGELDKTPGSHGGIVSEEDVIKNGFTNPEKAKEFAEKTEIDSFAISIGNSHGFSSGPVQLQFDILAKARELLDIPLVLHGGSGIPEKIIKDAIKLGISEINIDSEIGHAFTYTLRNIFSAPVETADPRKILIFTKDAMQSVVEEKLEWFGSVGKAGI